MPNPSPSHPPTPISTSSRNLAGVPAPGRPSLPRSSGSHYPGSDPSGCPFPGYPCSGSSIFGARLLVAVLLVGLVAALPVVAMEERSVGGTTVRHQIETLLREQAADWTAGDLESFCSAYAEDVVFISPTGLTSGRQEVLERYQRRYPDKAARGALTLDLEEVRVAGPEEQARAASAVARWKLSYPDKEPAEGLTLLVFHREDGGAWKIVQDASL